MADAVLANNRDRTSRHLCKFMLVCSELDSIEHEYMLL